ncbi:RNA ligase family protein [Flexithrix dorotheae]|uniref:RNA ligase family protein n=1 Tax=Flexithrix dorotheae TaxID=70993 RepID=UPI00035C47DF|nr:RNA ligase family protein [Flexithrix dorotheae]
MALSRKYGRTYHYPFSPGTTSDDRINHDYWEDLKGIKKIVHTEKLDGENTCLNKFGVFARSHAAPTVHPWANYLKQKWDLIRNDLGDLEIFGENLYAIHSIEYQRLETHFFVFGIREHDKWLSWEETRFYADLLDFPLVPEIEFPKVTERDKFEKQVLEIVNQPSWFGSVDVCTCNSCTMEGIVTRNVAEYAVENFRQNVFKYVRKGHVKTDEHWTRNWKRAPLIWERKKKDEKI